MWAFDKPHPTLGLFPTSRHLASYQCFGRVQLAGKTVAVTGGARGIGHAIAQACSEAGMLVAIGDLSAEASTAAAKSLPGPASGHVLDVRDRASFSTRALRGEPRGSGVVATAVLPGVIRTEMTSEFSTPEVYVPREVGIQGRLFTTLPAGLADRLSRLTRADKVMH